MKISVCVATYNGEKYLKEQIDSILSQMEDGDELLVSDDGSVDGTISILESYGKKINLVSSDRVGGVVKNFSNVLSYATGDIVVLSDQDDVWLPGRLLKIRDELAGADLVVLNGYVVDDHLVKSGYTVFESVGVRNGFLLNLIKNTFVGCCMAFRKDILNQVIPLPSYLPWHDWYIGLVAELFYKVRRVETPYLLFRRHGLNTSNTCGKSRNSFKTKIIHRLLIFFSILTLCISKTYSRILGGFNCNK
jgi:glycosyltransferase involved in cell wall biosynthesis